MAAVYQNVGFAVHNILILTYHRNWAFLRCVPAVYLYEPSRKASVDGIMPHTGSSEALGAGGLLN